MDIGAQELAIKQSTHVYYIFGHFLLDLSEIQ